MKAQLGRSTVSGYRPVSNCRCHAPIMRSWSRDLLGDAYEYLMRHFATESGKRAFLHVGQGEDFSGASRRLDPNRIDFERVQAKGASASS